MTQLPDKEDDQWLNVLAGRSDPAADYVVKQQAEALRRVLQAQRAKLEELVPQADDAQYQQLLFRLKREGLIKNSGPLRSFVSWGQVKGQQAAKTMLASNSALWGMAATLVLVVGVIVQMGGPRTDQEDLRNDVLRGGQTTVMIVENPESRLVELLAGLKAAGAEPVVRRETGGRILVTVKSSDKVLDYLREQRNGIDPTVVDGMVTLSLEPNRR
jgi:hypothetical protein